MVAHGFTIGMMVELVRAGLATATAERGKTIGIARLPDHGSRPAVRREAEEDWNI